MLHNQDTVVGMHQSGRKVVAVYHVVPIHLRLDWPGCQLWLPALWLAEYIQCQTYSITKYIVIEP